ncbi:MAG: hypothetical protein PUI03_04580 [Erysipelotrichaceae bacterium]|nr:hypothetical protein [Erysipelotrichaceae bacterium]
MIFKELPKELADLEKIYGPYLEQCHLREDAPKEAVEALEKARKLASEMGQ